MSIYIGGPAGLVATLTAAEQGVNTAIIESSYVLDGQLRQQVQKLDNLLKNL